MKTKLVPALILALFFVPIGTAVVLHSQWVDWQAPAERAHGELVDPVVPLGEFNLPDAAGKMRSRNDLTGRWHLAFATRSGCDAPCRKTLGLMHNIRRAQDRHIDQVGLVLIAAEPVTPATLRRIETLDPSWTVFAGDAGRALLERLPGTPPDGFYIVDPEANIMERFDPGTDPTGIRKDLDRLLTWTIRE